ncbi:hypothetical protein FKM82_013682 [Ascaphus truei]
MSIAALGRDCERECFHPMEGLIPEKPWSSSPCDFQHFCKVSSLTAKNCYLSGP